MKAFKLPSVTGMLIGGAGLAAGLFVPMLISIVVRLVADAMAFAADTIATTTSIGILMLAYLLMGNMCKFGIQLFMKGMILGVIGYQLLSLAGINIALISMVHPAVVTHVAEMNIFWILLLLTIMESILILFTFFILRMCGGKDQGICGDKSIVTIVNLMGIMLILVIAVSILFWVYIWMEMTLIGDCTLDYGTQITLAVNSIMTVLLLTIMLRNLFGGKESSA